MPEATARIRLTAAGVTYSTAGGGAALAAADVLVSPGLGWPFALLFMLLCGWASARARRDALFTAAVLPPLALLAAAVVATLTRAVVGDVRDVGRELLTVLGGGWPALAMATAVGTGLAVVRRLLAGQPGRRRPTPPARPAPARPIRRSPQPSAPGAAPEAARR